SILWRSALIRCGIRWKVGAGRTVKAFYNPWIPRPTTFKPITPTNLVPSSWVVLDFILNNRLNIEFLNQIFYPVDVEATTKIPISVLGSEDRGELVRRGYGFAVVEKSLAVEHPE
ncbi:hypothetical protein PanWU01x14_286410, partial [Parasponia andersonii]